MKVVNCPPLNNKRLWGKILIMTSSSSKGENHKCRRPSANTNFCLLNNKRCLLIFKKSQYTLYRLQCSLTLPRQPTGRIYQHWWIPSPINILCSIPHIRLKRANPIQLICEKKCRRRKRGRIWACIRWHHKINRRNN